MFSFLVKFRTFAFSFIAIGAMSFGAEPVSAEDAAKRAEIDSAADAAITRMFEEDRRAERLMHDAIAMLISLERI